MLTAKISAGDKINGLALGADDYVTKPFLPLELITGQLFKDGRQFVSYRIDSATTLDGLQWEEANLEKQDQRKEDRKGVCEGGNECKEITVQ